MFWEIVQYVGLVVVIGLLLCLLILLYALGAAAISDYRQRKGQEKINNKFFKMIERFRRDFD